MDMQMQMHFKSTIEKAFQEKETRPTTDRYQKLKNYELGKL